MGVSKSGRWKDVMAVPCHELEMRLVAIDMCCVVLQSCRAKACSPFVVDDLNITVCRNVEDTA